MPKYKKPSSVKFVVYPEWKPRLGNSLAAVWLASYFYYWSKRGKLEIVHKSLGEIYEESQLGEAQVRAARKILEAFGLIVDVEARGLPKRLYFTLDWTNLKTDSHGDSNPEPKEPRPPKAQPKKRRRSYSEILAD